MQQQFPSFLPIHTTDEAWSKFENYGSVEAYLQYRNALQQEGFLSNDSENKRHRDEHPQSWRTRSHDHHLI